MFALDFYRKPMGNGWSCLRESDANIIAQMFDQRFQWGGLHSHPD